MCGVYLVDRKNMEELMEKLGLKKTLDRMAKAIRVRWYGHVISRDDDNILKAMMISEWTAKARTAKNDMEEAGGRECEEIRVKDRGICRSHEMEGRCESDRGGDEEYHATFGNEEKTGLKLDSSSSSKREIKGKLFFCYKCKKYNEFKTDFENF